MMTKPVSAGGARLSGDTPGEYVNYHRTPRDPRCAPAQIRSRFTRLVGTPRRYSMRAQQAIARNLSAAFLAGDWSLEGLVKRGGLAWGRRERWLRPLARRVLAAFGNGPVPLHQDLLAKFIIEDQAYAQACLRSFQRREWPARQLFWTVSSMSPHAGTPMTWQLPALPTTAALADWLGLTPKELAWFADCFGREAKVPLGPLRHYTYRWLVSARGKARLLEMPKKRLKAIQRNLLNDIVARIPPHPAAHGFRPGRSVATFAAPHCNRRIVLRLDLRFFFASIPRSRIHAAFATAGYPSSVARLLTGLCTNTVPSEVCEERSKNDPQDWETHNLLRAPHLPQGAPTSPALANLCAYRLDCRLTALARKVGAVYTRYADDLAFSGDRDFERRARPFYFLVCRIALEEGFEINTRKTRFLRRGVRQRIAGVVLNAHPNLQRLKYDRLKAILFNCVRNGPESQNRDGRSDFRAYVVGRIAYLHMLNPQRAQKLRNLFDRIQWE